MKIPVSTYRLQFNSEFTFSDAEKILDYLSMLGITDIYASPVFKAASGSMHGYDIVDHGVLNPELGSGDDFKLLHEKRETYGMGWIQDIVPNHMAFHRENLMLRDLLELGDKSRFKDFFDIEWHHHHESLRGRLLAPFLGTFYSESLDRGEIRIVYTGEGLFVKYYEHEFPLSLNSYPVVFGGDLQTIAGGPGIRELAAMNLGGVLHQFTILHESHESGTDYDRRAHAKKMLRGLYDSDVSIRDYMDMRLSLYDSTGGEENALRLDSILEMQGYRLALWKVATEEINYRRFFNINGLISLRVEDKEVFDYTHRLIVKLISDRAITGIRVDHVDGLCNPLIYLKRLRDISDDLYITVEKIISKEETLHTDWPVQGSTGYDFLNQVNGIFCKTGNAGEFSRIYFRFTGIEYSFDELVAEKKRYIIERHMTGDVDNLAVLLKQISGNDRYGRDITMASLRKALVEIIAFFPVYRTYIDSAEISETDGSFIRTSFEKARRYSPEYSFEYDFLERCLMLKYMERMDENKQAELLRFITRFQQYTGPFMAKGFEDTVLYIVNRLISLNEVGGDPVNFGNTLEDFHDFISCRAASHLYSMNATSTHDTKRGEDVRCRINVLSEIPGEWKLMVRTWSTLNSKKKVNTGRRMIPDRNDEYFLYQTLTGTYPFSHDEVGTYVSRIKDYMIKAVREAKVHTAWIKPDSEYEENLLRFIGRILEPSEGNRFLKHFIPFQRKIAFFGLLNSLSQVIIKIASPGVPDFYQGTELWDLNLVDPDNRRMVDFKARALYLEYIKERERADLPGLIDELWNTKSDGRIKLFLVYRLLQLRNRMKRLFHDGDYITLTVEGRLSGSVIAFMRKHGEFAAIAAAPRFLASSISEGELPAGELWHDTRIILPQGFYSEMKNAITGEDIAISGEIFLRDLFRSFPGALLTGIQNER